MTDLPESADIVIVGGAVMGSSIAYHLASHPAFSGSILVVEKDPTYARAASALSAASIRQQYSSAINIRISLFGIEFLRNIGHYLQVDGEAPVIDLHEGGYLYLASQAGHAVLSENHAVQRQEGADIALFDQAGLAQQFPWLRVEDLVCGTWGRSGEGWFDGWALMQAFRRKARALGVRYVQDEVVGIKKNGSAVCGVTLASGARIGCGLVINAAGAQGRHIAAMAGIDIPVVPKKRFVYSFHCKTPLAGVPLLIDPSGAWCRPEGPPDGAGQLFIGSIGPAEAEDDPEMAADDFEVDPHLFEDRIWPALAHRIPAFEEIRPGRAWAGPYDMNLFDHNALIGPVEGVKGFLLANGFSGHGLQQSPAVGRGLAEYVLTGAYQTLDLSDLSFARLAANKPVLEKCVI
jgi:FAD-dependent oxidoreductase domain-containing protein 1